MFNELLRGIAVVFDDRLKFVNRTLTFGLSFDVALDSPFIEGIASPTRADGKAQLLPCF